MEIRETINLNRKNLKECKLLFKDIFNLNLSDFLGNPTQLLTGFDIISFSEAIGTPDNYCSTKEFVLNKYGGGEAVKLIYKLL